MSEDTLEALSSITFCPICGKTGIDLEEISLWRLDINKDGYRKHREILGKCLHCESEGRGEVRIEVNQRF